MGEAAVCFTAAAAGSAADGSSSLPSLASPFSLTSSCRACVQSPTSFFLGGGLCEGGGERGGNEVEGRTREKGGRRER